MEIPEISVPLRNKMKEQLKKQLSFFFLLLFLFPLIEKEAHGLECDTDIHCTADENHFHNLEHHCAICDFTVTDSYSPTINDYQLINVVHQFSFQLFTENAPTLSAFQHLPSRAPPLA